MEFWEAAVLVVGGVWLVSHMAKRNQQAAQTVVGTSILGATGTSNQSNLTNITNTAGGQPTVYGEPLVAPNPPLQLPVTGPFLVPTSTAPVHSPIATPVASPIFRTPARLQLL